MESDENRSDGPERTFESGKEAREALLAGKRAIVEFGMDIQRWVQRRGRFSQFIIAGVISVVLNEMRTFSWNLSVILPSSVPVFSTNQLLIVLIGAITGQTMIQTSRLNQLEDGISGMDSPETRTDGGGDLPPRDDEGKFKSKKSGGGAVGGAIAGAALGSSYGPAGTVAGALFGAILGDELEEQSMNED